MDAINPDAANKSINENTNREINFINFFNVMIIKIVERN